MDPAVVDSLQTVRDTLVIVQAESTSWLEWVSLGVSVLIAGFTGGYLCYTIGIFEKTEEQAWAARESAKASRKAAKASKESLEEQKRLNDAQIEATEQERIERAHPLLWMNLELTSEREEEWVELSFENASNVPALDIDVALMAKYGPDYLTAEELDERIQENVGNIEGFLNLVTKIKKDILTSHTISTAKLRYPVRPISLSVILQYRDIHGKNYGRFFHGSSVLDTSKLDERSPTPESVVQYKISETVPKEVHQTPRIFLTDSPRLMMVWENDRRGDAIDDPIIIGYLDENDSFLVQVAHFNTSLANAFKTSLFHYSFKAKSDDDGTTPFHITTPPP
jgi:hypothetical protein